MPGLRSQPRCPRAFTGGEVTTVERDAEERIVLYSGLRLEAQAGASEGRKRLTETPLTAGSGTGG